MWCVIEDLVLLICSVFCGGVLLLFIDDYAVKLDNKRGDLICSMHLSEPFLSDIMLNGVLKQDQKCNIKAVSEFVSPSCLVYRVC